MGKDVKHNTRSKALHQNVLLKLRGAFYKKRFQENIIRTLLVHLFYIVLKQKNINLAEE